MTLEIVVHVDHEDTGIDVNGTGTGLIIRDKDDEFPIPQHALKLFFGGSPRAIQHNAQLLIDALRKLQGQQDDS